MKLLGITCISISAKIEELKEIIKEKEQEIEELKDELEKSKILMQMYQ